MRGTQFYETNPSLATRVASLAKRLSADLVVEIGVGEGAIWRHLPSPKRGVEVRRPQTPPLDGVDYGEDAMEWAPPPCSRLCVVMNPPFCSQVALFNRASSFVAKDLFIVWIAGMGVRSYSNEQKLDAHMHLIEEHGAGQSLFFHEGAWKKIAVCVQVWKKEASPRPRLTLPSCDDLSFEVHTSAPEEGDILVKRLGSVGRVGCWEEYREGKRIEMGTLIHGKGGTAWILRCANDFERSKLKQRLEERKDAFALCLECRLVQSL